MAAKLAASTRKGKKHIEAREPQIFENPKKCLFLRGGKCSQIVQNFMKDLALIKAPFVKRLNRKNPMILFEDDSSLEDLAKKFDSSLFCYGKSSKKRPHSITIGRCFDFQVLDMFEFLLDPESVRPLSTKSAPGIVQYGSKPMMVFHGDAFENNPDGTVLKNVLIDYFRGVEVDNINLAGLDRVIMFYADEDLSKLEMRHYAVSFTKSGNSHPSVHLHDIGPSAKMSFSRRSVADIEVVKKSLKKPKLPQVGKVKNVEKGVMGQTLGRVHMGKQNLSDIATRKFTKRKKVERARHLAEKAAKKMKTQ